MNPLLAAKVSNIVDVHFNFAVCLILLYLTPNVWCYPHFRGNVVIIFEKYMELQQY